jgi:hypothetical protein
LAHINLNLASITQGADSDCESRHIQIAHGFFSQLGDVQANNPGVVSTTNIANIYPKYQNLPAFAQDEWHVAGRFSFCASAFFFVVLFLN